MSATARRFRGRPNSWHRELLQLREIGCNCHPKIVTDDRWPPLVAAVCVEHERGCPLGAEMLKLERQGIVVAIGARAANRGCTR